MSPETDPYVDSYMTTIASMSTKEMMNLPKLSDADFLDQLTRGNDTIPILRQGSDSTKLFDLSIDEPVEFQPDLENE
ncbi:unnamed protein product [Rotaria magnacalcarata]|uniref:Uncharacterized protein n=1 Tax=Rotaria magnacalcarata TaxID=392030 RepID=A0A816Z4W1_9BILA|nr:unnamed protein product [Rotaria magnacalcarata]CAF2251751.1 unnamed protein product [Rotaria magnacalcarata]CAF4106141.1 unnamed protein product [Rotaria magnacalcarata]CAF4167492.1 unnamed protein product [Rotaria magnacalcarata]